MAERRHGQVDRAGALAGPQGQLRAAGPAKVPFAVVAGAKDLRPLPRPAKPRFRHRGPGHAGAARRRSAGPAMAAGHVDLGIVGDLVRAAPAFALSMDLHVGLQPLVRISDTEYLLLK